MSSKVAVIGEAHAGTLSASTLHAVNAATQMAAASDDKVSLLLLGHLDEIQDSVVKDAASTQGVDDVIVAHHSALQHGIAENVASVLQKMQEDKQ